MQVRGRRLRFTAVLAIVVLALTGFSRGHHNSSRHGGGSGGGCNSSHQDHDSSSSSSSSGGGSSSYDDSYGSGYSSSGGSYNRRPTHRATSTPSGGSGTAQVLDDGTAKLLSCATRTKPYATVEAGNPNSRKGTFDVRVSFKDRSGHELGHSHEEAEVPAKGRATVRVRAAADLIDSLDHCEVDPSATPVD
ncbi:hypothetical protein [Streptomyces sp. NPDC046197]|uniref:hypothetical protein n=1 Tax=Streptomyces sp. NPDC046197 TaxID=3154337 RepID=UPI0033EFC1D4